jgi:hypothetical protein
VTDTPREEFIERILLIVLISLASISILFFLGMVLIQSIMLVGNIALVPGILAWEKFSRRESEKRTKSDSIDSKKSEIKRIHKEIARTKNPNERNALISRMRTIENELRQLEWTRREKEMDELGTPRDKIARVDLFKFLSERRSEGTENPSDSDEEKRKYFSKLLADAREILSAEPRSSIGAALRPITSEFAAIFNSMKKSRAASPSVLSDCWACWAILNSVSNGLKIEPIIRRHVSSKFRKNYDSFIGFIKAKDLVRPQDLVE